MTTINEQKPKPDTRYAKQEMPQGDFVAGERTTPITPQVGDFASGAHTVPTPPTSIDKSESPAKLIVYEGEFATWVLTTPLAPAGPDLVQTIPSVPVATDRKE